MGEEKEKGGKSRAHEDNQLHTTLHASDARGEAKKDPRHSRAVPLHLRSYLSRVEGSLEAKRSSRRRSSPHPTNHQPALVCVCGERKGKGKGKGKGNMKTTLKTTLLLGLLTALSVLTTSVEAAAAK